MSDIPLEVELLWAQAVEGPPYVLFYLGFDWGQGRKSIRCLGPEKVRTYIPDQEVDDIINTYRRNNAYPYE